MNSKNKDPPLAVQNQKTNNILHNKRKVKKMTNLQENGATTVQVKKNVDTNLITIGEIDMTNLQENVAATVQDEVNPEFIFGSKNHYITENEAIQKLFILANSILDSITSTKDNFQFAVFYKNLNNVLYCEQLSEKLFEKEVFNDLEDWGDFQVFNPTFCSHFVGKSNLWYHLDLNRKSTDYSQMQSLLNKFKNTNVKSPLEVLKGKINLIDILSIDRQLKSDFQNLELLELSFLFDVKHKRNKTLAKNSELFIILSLSENQNKKDPVCRRYILKTRINYFLESSEYLPSINVKEHFINEDLAYIPYD